MRPLNTLNKFFFFLFSSNRMKSNFCEGKQMDMAVDGLIRCGSHDNIQVGKRNKLTLWSSWSSLLLFWLVLVGYHSSRIRSVSRGSSGHDYHYLGCYSNNDNMVNTGPNHMSSMMFGRNNHSTSFSRSY